MQRRRSILVVVFATILIDFIGFSALVPVLPLYAETLGAAPSQVGLILSFHALAQLLFLPAWGFVSDRIGRRPVILVSLAGTALSFLVLAVATSIGVIYAGRLLSGFFAASVGAAQAVVTDITEEEDRAHGMGMVGAAVGLGMVLGPAMGGAVAAWHPQAPFWVVAALSAINFVSACIWLPETLQRSGRPARWGELGRLLVPAPLRLVAAVHDRRIALYLVVFLLVFTALGVLESMAPLLLSHRYAAPVLEVALVFACLGIVFVFTQGVLLRPLVERFGEPRLVLVGLVAMGLALAAMVVAPGLAAFYPIVAVFGAGMGVAFPTFTSLFSRACEAEQAGELLAESQAVGMTGRMLGPFAAGHVVERVSYTAPFAGAAAIVAAALLLIWVARRDMRVRRPRRRRRRGETPG